MESEDLHVEQTNNRYESVYLNDRTKEAMLCILNLYPTLSQGP